MLSQEDPLQESDSNMYTIMLESNPQSMSDAGYSMLGLVPGDDPERCYGERGRRGVHVWELMYTRGGFMSMYGKTNTVL